MNYQSLSGIMQLYAKAQKKFVKTAPATYALIEVEAQINESESNEETVVYDDEFIGEINEEEF